MTLMEDVNNGIKEAMRSKNRIRLDTLRMLKSKVLTVDARGELPDSEVTKLFKTYYGNLQEALDQAIQAKREEMADQLKKEIDIVLEFLPKALSREETKKIVEQAISAIEAKTKKDLGLVMKEAMKINSSIDGKLTKELADELLEN